MSLTWLVPAAVAGLAALAVPVIVHLLVRQRSRPIPFPSIRFLQTSPLSSMARRALADRGLLLVRAGVVAAAVAALAGPVLVTPAREQRWAERMTRAIVVVGDAGAGAVSAEQRDVAASREFATGQPAIDLRAAAAWIARAGTGIREIAVVGSPLRGSLSEADIAAIPEGVGLRFVPDAPSRPVREREVERLHATPAGLEIVRVRLGLDPSRTTVEEIGRTPAPPEIITVRAGRQQAAAERLLHAVLVDGLRLPREAGVRVTVTWPETGGAVSAGSTPRVIVMEGRPEGLDAARRLREALESALADPLDAWEPERMAAADLRPWERPATPSAGPPVDEGDRRWLWALALALLAIEHAWRRASLGHARPQGSEERARVA